MRDEECRRGAHSARHVRADQSYRGGHLLDAAQTPDRQRRRWIAMIEVEDRYLLVERALRVRLACRDAEHDRVAVACEISPDCAGGRAYSREVRREDEMRRRKGSSSENDDIGH